MDRLPFKIARAEHSSEPFYLHQAAVRSTQKRKRGSRFHENLRQATVGAQWQYLAATVSYFDLFAF